VAETVIRNDRRTESDTDTDADAISNADHDTHSDTQCHTNSDTYRNAKCNSESHTDSNIYAYSDTDSDANCHGNPYTKTRPDPKTSAHSTAASNATIMILLIEAFDNDPEEKLRIKWTAIKLSHENKTEPIRPF
jgi:hypothetical protein